MKALLPISLALALLSVGGTSYAADQADPHHPAQPAAAPQAPIAPAQAEHRPAVGESHAANAKVDAQLLRMREMHHRWAKATPAEREGLMAEHMATMREGMKMMHEMSAGPMPGAGHSGAVPPRDASVESAKGGMHDHMSGEMKERHDAMQQRMRMMEEMMQMMMDRLADPPAKH